MKVWLPNVLNECRNQVRRSSKSMRALSIFLSIVLLPNVPNDHENQVRRNKKEDNEAKRFADEDDAMYWKHVDSDHIDWNAIADHIP